MPKKAAKVSKELRTFRKVLGQRIASAREQASLRKADLARELKVSPSTINDWESGRTGATALHLSNIARTTGVSGSWLLPSPLPGDATPERLADDLAAVLGGKRLTALAKIPENRLRREIDAIIGSWAVDGDSIPTRPRSRS